MAVLRPIKKRFDSNELEKDPVNGFIDPVKEFSDVKKDVENITYDV